MPVTLIEPCRAKDYGLLSRSDPVAKARKSKMSWGIAQIGAAASPFTGTGVSIAILDTGIAWDHPAFAGMARTQKNFTQEGSPDEVTDYHGHGTHCAAVAFGRDVDGVRIGVAKGVHQAVVAKVLDSTGKGSTAAVLEALHWAKNKKADIISMSLGFDFPEMQIQLVAQGIHPKIATSLALKA